MICKKLKECYECERNGSRIKKCENNNHDNCVKVFADRPKIKCEEKGKKYTLENTNKNHVISYKIDDGVIVKDKSVSDEIRKCDYGFFIDKETAILIELKGCHSKDAIEQIGQTLTLFKGFLKEFSHVYARIIVASNAPKKMNPKRLELEKRLRQEFGGNLKIKQRSYEEKDNEFRE